MNVTVSAVQFKEEAIEVRFTVDGWGAPNKRGTLVQGESTLSVHGLRDVLEVQEVVLCPDGTVGLRVGNDHGRLHIVGIRDEQD